VVAEGDNPANSKQRYAAEGALNKEPKMRETQDLSKDRPPGNVKATRVDDADENSEQVEGLNSMEQSNGRRPGNSIPQESG